MNAFHKIATRFIRKIQSLLGLITLGPRAIVLNTENQILLVKHTYQPHWYYQVAVLKKGESLKAALLRELKEEVGFNFARRTAIIWYLFSYLFGC